MESKDGNAHNSPIEISKETSKPLLVEEERKKQEREEYEESAKKTTLNYLRKRKGQKIHQKKQKKQKQTQQKQPQKNDLDMLLDEIENYENLDDEYKKGDVVTLRAHYFQTQKEKKHATELYFEVLANSKPRAALKLERKMKAWHKDATFMRVVGEKYPLVFLKFFCRHVATKVNVRTWSKTDPTWEGNSTHVHYHSVEKRIELPSNLNLVERTRNWFLPPYKLPSKVPKKEANVWKRGHLIKQTETNSCMVWDEFHKESLHVVDGITQKGLWLIHVNITEDGVLSFPDEVTKNRDKSKRTLVKKELLRKETSTYYKKNTSNIKYEYYDYHAKSKHVLVSK